MSETGIRRRPQTASGRIAAEEMEVDIFKNPHPFCQRQIMNERPEKILGKIGRNFPCHFLVAGELERIKELENCSYVRSIPKFCGRKTPSGQGRSPARAEIGRAAHAYEDYAIRI